MTIADYKIVLYWQEELAWVAEIPAISGCYAMMPTPEQAVGELIGVFRMISEEYQEKGLLLPIEATEFRQT
jgi:predicted RNase H-like HicB family nuclease